MQVCHGKHAPLLRVPPGDRMAYYAPALAMGGKEKLQSFVPYRSNVAYVQSCPCWTGWNCLQTGRAGVIDCTLG